MLFLKTQKPIARLWKRERDTENELLGDFSQSLAAYEDIAGLKKQNFVLNEMEKKFGTLEKQYGKRPSLAIFHPPPFILFSTWRRHSYFFWEFI